VLVAKRRFLAPSETFLFDELLGWRRYRASGYFRFAPADAAMRLPPPAEVLAERWPADRGVGAAIERTAAAIGAPLVYLPFGFNAVRALWPLDRRLGLPTAVSLHGHDVGYCARLLGGGLDRLAAVVDAVLVRSWEMAARTEDLGVPHGKIRMIRVGVPLDRFAAVQRNPTHPPEFVCNARLVEKKGIEDLIGAAALLRADGAPPFQVRINGEGDLRPALETLVRALGVADLVSLPGWASRRAVRDGLAGATALVLASCTGRDGDAEGVPVAIIEALAAGVPVVATRHAGIPEILRDGEAGFLVPEQTPSALARAMRRILDGAAFPGMAAAQARVRRRHDLTAQNALVERTFDDLIAVARPSAAAP